MQNLTVAAVLEAICTWKLEDGGQGPTSIARGTPACPSRAAWGRCRQRAPREPGRRLLEGNPPSPASRLDMSLATHPSTPRDESPLRAQQLSLPRVTACRISRTARWGSRQRPDARHTCWPRCVLFPHTPQGDPSSWTCPTAACQSSSGSPRAWATSYCSRYQPPHPTPNTEGLGDVFLRSEGGQTSCETPCLSRQSAWEELGTRAPPLHLTLRPALPPPK